MARKASLILGLALVAAAGPSPAAERPADWAYIALTAPRNGEYWDPRLGPVRSGYNARSWPGSSASRFYRDCPDLGDTTLGSVRRYFGKLIVRVQPKDDPEYGQARALFLEYAEAAGDTVLSSNLLAGRTELTSYVVIQGGIPPEGVVTLLRCFYGFSQTSPAEDLAVANYLASIGRTE